MAYITSRAGSCKVGRTVSAAQSFSNAVSTVKVLYTFDDENKSNCLARLPGAMSIPTVAVDESTEVGVIELRACIRAIVAAR